MGDVRWLRPLPPPVPVSKAEPDPERGLLWREAVGRQLRLERVVRGERIVDVARRAAVSPQYLSEVERGLKDPSSEVLFSLATAVELPVRELVRRACAHLSVVPASGAVRSAPRRDPVLRAA